LSNVDLSSQMADLITAQRAFEANSKIITTSDELLQDVVNMKR
jgi:flagellar hook protein FlgE